MQMICYHNRPDIVKLMIGTLASLYGSCACDTIQYLPADRIELFGRLEFHIVDERLIGLNLVGELGLLGRKLRAKFLQRRAENEREREGRRKRNLDGKKDWRKMNKREREENRRGRDH